MIKDFLKKIEWNKYKDLFLKMLKKIPLPKKKPASRPEKKKAISLPKKKIELPNRLKAVGNALVAFFSKKLVSRLTVGICAVALGGVLILWDLGLIDLPFLVRRDRREPIKETQTQEESTTTKKKNNSEQGFADAALALETIRSLYAYAGVNTSLTPITDLIFDRDTMTITKQILPEGSFTAAMGFVVKTKDGKELLFTACDNGSDGSHPHPESLAYRWR